MNALKRMSFIIALSLTAIAPSPPSYSMSKKEAQAQYEEIWRNGAWAPISSSEGGKWLIDYKTLRDSGDSMAFWIVVPGRGIQKWVIDCIHQRYRIHLFNIRTFNSGLEELSVDYSMPEGSVAYVVYKKVCGRFIPSLGVKVKYLFSDDTHTVYWIPSLAYRGAQSVTSLVYVEVPADGSPGEITPASMFFYWEVDCVASRGRTGASGPWRQIQKIEAAVKWNEYSDGTSGVVVRNKLCADPKIVFRQADVELGGASSMAEASMALDAAKEKCLELGFKSGTERFGECVLTLSK